MMLRKEDIKVEKDCTHLVPPEEDEAEKKERDISVESPVETLRSLELCIIQRQINLAPYAGNAFLTDDKEFAQFLKGQYAALEALRKTVSDKYLRLAVEQDRKEEKESYAVYVAEQYETLKDYDHNLFNELVKGLVTEGWTEEGGSGVFRLLNKQGAAIKIFRDADAPAVIKVCFSAEPEEAKVTCKSLKVEIKSREEDEET